MGESHKSPLGAKRQITTTPTHATSLITSYNITQPPWIRRHVYTLTVASLVLFFFLQLPSTKKYEQPTRYIPSAYLRNTKVSYETCTEMNPSDQRRLQQSDTPLTTLTVEALEAHDSKHTTGPCQLRQFACLPCRDTWWRNVLKSNPVSRCRGRFCRNERYDALPRNEQFGIGRFLCPNIHCSREFFGYCEATEQLACRKCGTFATPYIHPKWRKSRPSRSRLLNPKARVFRPHKSDDVGPRFESLKISEGRGGSGGKQSSGSESELCAFPRGDGRPHSSFTPSSSDSEGDLSQASSSSSLSPSSLNGFLPSERAWTRREPPSPKRRPRIFNPSRVHEPTGGTISTFLTQIDFDQEYEEVVLDYDSVEDENKVGVCLFVCGCCRNEYTVVCRLIDTAPCYKCHMENQPQSWAPPREIQSESNYKHRCSRCHGARDCPNLCENTKQLLN